MSFGEITTTRTTVANDTWTSSVFKDNNRLLWVHVEYTADVGAGTRQIVLQLLDQDDNVLLDCHAGATQAASQVRHYAFMPGVYRETSFVNDEIQISFPQVFMIQPNQRLRVLDTGAIDANDSMVITYQTERR